MKCEQCGTEAEPDAAFCGGCGAAFALTEATERIAPVEPVEPVAVATPAVPSTPAAAAAATAAATTPVAPRKSRRRGLLVGAIALWTVAAIAMGAAAGYELFNRNAAHSAGDIVVRRVVAPSEKVSAANAVMPDVEGLTRENALLAVADSGLDPSTVKFAEKPDAAPAGSVVVQTPLRGTRAPKNLELTLAIPGTIPDLKGQTSAAATSTLQGLGVQVLTVQVYDASVAVDQVISTDPGPGAPLAANITLKVSTSASSVYLSDLRAISISCSTGSATVSGTVFDHSLQCDNKGNADYNLGGLADAITATLGISDKAKAGTTARIDVLADGRPLTSFDLVYGQTKSLDAILKGVIRLEFRVTSTDQGVAVIADARLIGSPTSIDTLSKATR